MSSRGCVLAFRKLKSAGIKRGKMVDSVHHICKPVTAATGFSRPHWTWNSSTFSNVGKEMFSDVPYGGLPVT